MTIAITDHAVLRFLERKKGLDVDALRGEIKESLARASAAAGEIALRDYNVRANDLLFVVRNGRLVTVCEIESGLNMTKWGVW